MPKIIKKFDFFSLLGSRLFLFISFSILLILFVVLAKEVFHSYEINREIKDLEIQVKSLENQSQELVELLTYLNTEEFKLQEAKNKLFLRQPGEKVIAFLPSSQEGQVEENINQEMATKQNHNFKPSLWWQYFFSN